MGQRDQQSRKTVEGHVVFEVRHLAEGCLADAYERLVPILRRSLALATTPQQVDPPHRQRALSIRRRQS